MPCLSGYRITIGDPQTVTIPQATIAGRVLADDGVTVVADFTEGAAIDFATILARFTSEQLAAFMDMVAADILYSLAGVTV